MQNEEGLVLLTGTFLDASLYPIGGTARLHLSKVVIDSNIVRICIGDANTDELASTEFDFASSPDVLHFKDSFDRPAGLLVSDAERLSLFAGWPTGEHRFTADETAFVSRCCIPMPAVGFRGFELEDGSILSGDIRLIADNGIVFTLEQLELPATPDEAAQSVNVVRVDVVGDCLSRRKLCVDDDAFETPRLLQTLRVSSPAASGESSPVAAEGDPDVLFLVDSSWSREQIDIDCLPDTFGNISITAGSLSVPDTVLRIRPSNNGLIIEAVGRLLGDIR